MSQLATGTYMITSAMEGNPIVGRPLAEDFSLLPKRVVTLPPGQSPPRPWVAIQNDGEGSYTLKVGDAPTTHIDDKLFAILLEVPPPTAWRITPVPQCGQDAYIITTQEQDKGWVVTSDEPQSDIAVRPLIVGPSYPPFYPPNEVFIFRRLQTE